MAQHETSLLFIGSMTRPTPYFEGAKGLGLSVYRFNETDGSASLLRLFQGVDNPSFIAIDRDRRFLYVSTEVYGWNEGTVTAFAYDDRSGALRYINKQPTLGSCTAHCSLDRNRKILFATNYAHEKWEGFYGDDVPGKAVCTFPVRDDGSLGPVIDSVAHHGSSSVPVRQDQPHPHCAIASPDNRFVLVADLGVDCVFTYAIEAGMLKRTAEFKLAGGAGPRHLTFSTQGDLVYLINELNSTISVLSYDPRTGGVALVQTVSTIPRDFMDENRCSDLQLSGDGRFLYGANRGHDSVAIFAVEADGRLEMAGLQPCGGRTPRNISLSSSGGILLVANQNSDTVTVFSRDVATGLLSQINAIEVGTPMVVVSAPSG